MDQPNKRTRLNLMLCAGTACVSMHSFGIRDALQKELERHELTEEVQIVPTGCNGFCAVGPVMTVMPDGIFYQKLTVEIIPRLVEEHFLKGRPLPELMFKAEETKETIPLLSKIGFFSHQSLIVLRNRGLIDPEKIDDYIGRDGYKALAKVLKSMEPEEVIAEMKRSGLRGRGGAGFSTGLKWEFTRKEPGAVKYIICNCDEGDPGAYMDRSVVESDPHSVLEGMLIAAWAIGAGEGVVYIREEYPLALERMETAIRHATEYGLLGEDIFGTGWSFSVSIKRGAGAFVCGEETSLIHSIEGTAPEPTQKPPFPAQSGLWGKPTCINNVETFANVAPILLRGADWFSSLGTEKSKGTKVFSLVGKIRNTGLIEVPMGTPLRKIIYDIGGGIPDGRSFKAVQTGGPSGGCIPASLLDLPVDYERLTEAGSIMGSGGMIVMDDSTCIVDISKYFLEFTNSESCGKCTSCRDGSAMMLEVLDRITKGGGRESDITFLQELSAAIKDASMCGLGQTLPNPVLSTLRYFPDEYRAHILDRKCPAKVCKALIRYDILPDKCTGCTLCRRNCPHGAITGEPKKLHVIDQEKCKKCNICFEVCKFDAVRIE